MKISKLITTLSVLGLAAGTLLAPVTAHAAKETTVNVAAPNGNPEFIVNTDHGPEGYYGELIKRIDHDLPQYKFKTTFTYQNAVFSGLQSGKYDVALNNSWYNASRFKNYYHTRATSLDDVRIIYRKNSPQAKYLKNATSLKPVAEHKLSMVPLATDDALYSVVKTYNDTHSPKVDLKPFGDQSTADALGQVASGKYDVTMYPYAAFREVQNTKDGKKLAVSKSIYLKSAYLLVHKSPQNKKLTAALNKEIDHLYRDGYLEHLTKKYIHENTFAFPNAKKAYNAEFNK